MNDERPEQGLPEEELAHEEAADVAASPEGEPTPEEAPDELEAAKAQAAEYLDHLQRLQAEFENFRKRAAREQAQATDLAAERLVLKLLEVLDEFELALVAAEQKPDLEKFTKGVEMVYAKLRETLRGEGLERIEADGKPFDPELHEALFQAGEGDGDPFVSEVFRTGYTLKGRVVRPAGVKVERR